MRNFAEINLNNIKENFRFMTKNLPAVAVVKADAYGHGASRVAQALDKEALAFAVSSVDEAEELVRSGLKTSVVILGDGYPPEFERALNGGIIISLGTLKGAVLLNELARKKNTRARVVICVDTGMNRDGFGHDNISDIAAVLEMKNISVAGIYSHLLCGSDADVTAAQRRKFELIRSVFSGRRNLFFSFSNSAAAGGDAYIPRIGISMYGLSPSGTKTDDALLPAMSFRAAILSARRVRKGEYIGYDRAFRAERDMTVATVAAGYADGVPRAYSNVGSVLIGNGRARIVGNICMDVFMVDASGIDFDIGDYVTVIGRNGDEKISAEDVARLCGTINYEIVCGISKRVLRIYRE